MITIIANPCDTIKNKYSDTMDMYYISQESSYNMMKFVIDYKKDTDKIIPISELEIIWYMANDGKIIFDGITRVKFIYDTIIQDIESHHNDNDCFAMILGIKKENL